MSVTAQRKDIYDLDVVASFAETIEDQLHLDYLYLLTVADICATNPTLWTSWKDSLLKELYQSTKKVLKLQNKSIDRKQIIRTKKAQARLQLRKQDIDSSRATVLWRSFADNYFMRESASNIAWHATSILENEQGPWPLILIKLHHTQSATEIFIYTPSKDTLFATNTAVLSNFHLNILEARIFSMKNGYTLDSYILLEDDGQPITDNFRLEYVKNTLLSHHKSDLIPRARKHRPPRHLQYFNKPTEITFTQDMRHKLTIMEVSTNDRPGLLALISKAIVDCHVRLHTAKIATMGERVEDTFMITDQKNRLLSNKDQQNQLRNKILEYLDTA